MPKTFRVEAIILKRHNFREADRFLTVFTQDQGKLDLLAKGVRKLSSRKRPALEIGNHAKLFCISTKSTSLVTQVELLHSFPHAKSSLTRITQIYQILEIIDLLTVEASPNPKVFRLLVHLLSDLNTAGIKRDHMLLTIKQVLIDLGFGLPHSNSETALQSHLESITERKLRTKDFFLSS